MSIKSCIRDKFIHPLIELLPWSLQSKLKMVGTCCFGVGWDYMLLASNPKEFCNVTEEDVKNLYKDLSEKSLQVLLDYLKYNHLSSAFCHYLNTSHNDTIIVPIKQLFPGLSNKIRMENKMRRCTKGKYKFKNLVSEVGYYHHGLKLLNNQVHEYIKGKVFLDLGAYNGDSAFVFSKYAPERILSFEPSSKNSLLCKENLAAEGIDCVEIIQAGVSELPGKMFLSENETTTTLGAEGEYLVECISIDSFLRQKDYGTIGVIKADLEGMGLKMIHGAIETIKQARPVLLLSIYHNRDEFMGIYDFLKQHIHNYRYRVEALSALREVTLIAYPDEICKDE